MIVTDSGDGEWVISDESGTGPSKSTWITVMACKVKVLFSLLVIHNIVIHSKYAQSSVSDVCH